MRCLSYGLTDPRFLVRDEKKRQASQLIIEISLRRKVVVVLEQEDSASKDDAEMPSSSL